MHIAFMHALLRKVAFACECFHLLFMNSPRLEDGSWIIKVVATCGIQRLSGKVICKSAFYSSLFSSLCSHFQHNSPKKTPKPQGYFF